MYIPVCREYLLYMKKYISKIMYSFKYYMYIFFFQSINFLFKITFVKGKEITCIFFVIYTWRAFFINYLRYLDLNILKKCNQLFVYKLLGHIKIQSLF